MAGWSELAAPLESYATIAALLAAGLWTWQLFVRQRKRYPRLATKLEVEQVFLVDRVVLLRVSVRVTNTGTVMVTSPRAELRLFQVVPAPREVLAKIHEKEDPVVEGSEIDWQEISRRDWTWEVGRWWGKPGDFEVEPGEADLLLADFTVGSETKVVVLYFYLCNPRKLGGGLWRLCWKLRRRFRRVKEVECEEEPPYELGWTETVLYRLNKKEEASTANEKKGVPPKSPKQKPASAPSKAPKSPAREPSTPSVRPARKQQRPKKR
jgi:hypothetical protein